MQVVGSAPGWEAPCHAPVPSEDVSLDVAPSGSLLPLPWSAQVPSQASPSPTGAHPPGAVPSLVLHAEDQLSPGAPGQGEPGGPGQTLGVTEGFYGDILLALAAEESRGRAGLWFPQPAQALGGPGCPVPQQTLHVCPCPAPGGGVSHRGGVTHTHRAWPPGERPRVLLWAYCWGGASEVRELLGLKLSCLLCPASIGHGGPHRLTPPAGQATPPRPQGSWSIRTRGALGSASNWGQLLAAGSGA